MSEQDYLRVVTLLRQFGVRLKVNTVVMRSNLREDLTDFMMEALPERWKLLQLLPVSGQNDDGIEEHIVSSDEFQGYVQRSSRVEMAGITVVPESNDLMTGSYVMVDPAEGSSTMLPGITPTAGLSWRLEWKRRSVTCR